MATKLKNAAASEFTIGGVTSKDGTNIGYRQIGHGSGVVLLHGAMSSSQTHSELAQMLADTFTVYIPDRRGRGLSGPYSNNYTIQKDVEDLEALLTKTGAHQVFGVSSGALILLQTALTLPVIHKAAIYEPPLSINGSAPTAWISRYDKEMAQGKLTAALITAMKGAQMGPSLFNLMPRWLLELLTNLAIKQENKQPLKDEVTWQALAPTLHYDGQLLVEMAERLESFRAIRASMLLLGGSKSPAYLKLALDGLEKVLPNVERIELAGLGHAGSWNSNRGGQPEKVAQALRQFFD
jgi:pimeloyl-ACP methyl ester carboxylesterase